MQSRGGWGNGGVRFRRARWMQRRGSAPAGSVLLLLGQNREQLLVQRPYEATRFPCCAENRAVDQPYTLLEEPSPARLLPGANEQIHLGRLGQRTPELVEHRPLPVVSGALLEFPEDWRYPHDFVSFEQIGDLFEVGRVSLEELDPDRRVKHHHRGPLCAIERAYALCREPGSEDQRPALDFVAENAHLLDGGPLSECNDE